MNLLESSELDRTYKNGTEWVDSITRTDDILKWIKESRLCKNNEVFDTDHRLYIIDINLEQYFDEKVSNLSEINIYFLDPSKKSY